MATTASSTFDQAVLETQVALAHCSAWLPAHLAAEFMFVWLSNMTVMSAVRIVVVTLSYFALGRPWLSWDPLSARTKALQSILVRSAHWGATTPSAGGGQLMPSAQRAKPCATRYAV